MCCRAGRAIVRMMGGVTLRDKKSSMELMSMVGMSDDIDTLVRKSMLRSWTRVEKERRSWD